MFLIINSFADLGFLFSPYSFFQGKRCKLQPTWGYSLRPGNSNLYLSLHRLQCYSIG